MILRGEIHITRGIAIVVLKVEPVLGPGIARAYLGLLNGTRRQPRAILGPKYARAIPGPKTVETFNTTITITQVMWISRLKIIMQGAVKILRRLVILSTWAPNELNIQVRIAQWYSAGLVMWRSLVRISVWTVFMPLPKQINMKIHSLLTNVSKPP